MQDGNWNTVAICDITGSVTKRYAYSAYGTPVFMTGAGVTQSSSPIGFETLYAGYRFDGNTAQMYHVRNRFLLPMIGAWNRKDPLGYVDGLSLYDYCSPNVIICTGDFGLAGPSGTTWTPPRGVGRGSSQPRTGSGLFRAIDLQHGVQAVFQKCELHPDFAEGIQHLQRPAVGRVGGGLLRMIGVAVDTAHDAAIFRLNVMSAAGTAMNAAVDRRCRRHQFVRRDIGIIVM